MINVLVVEDDPVALEAHTLGVAATPGFRVVGAVDTGGAALRFLGRHDVDVILLDFHLPDVDGLSVCRALRAAGRDVDVIAVTSVRDVSAVRAAVAHGIILYLLKPFTVAALREKLLRYAEYREQVGRMSTVTGQDQVDGIMSVLRSASGQPLPKGMDGATLDAVVGVLSTSADGLSASGCADAVGVSRVTARRYLEYLADKGAALRKPQYGKVGRPEVRFFLADTPS